MNFKAFFSVFFIKEIPDLIELKQKSLDKTLRGAFKKTIELLTAVIPTLDPPPIFDCLRFLFSREDGGGLLIGLLSKA